MRIRPWCNSWKEHNRANVCCNMEWWTSLPSLNAHSCHSRMVSNASHRHISYRTSRNCAAFTYASCTSLPETSLASMLTAATSFTITPTRRPSLFSKRCFNAVVFPVPKKPLRIVTGVSGAATLLLDAARRDVRPPRLHTLNGLSFENFWDARSVRLPRHDCWDVEKRGLDAKWGRPILPDKPTEDLRPSSGRGAKAKPDGRHVPMRKKCSQEVRKACAHGYQCKEACSPKHFRSDLLWGLLLLLDWNSFHNPKNWILIFTDCWRKMKVRSKHVRTSYNAAPCSRLALWPLATHMTYVFMRTCDSRIMEETSSP